MDCKILMYISENVNKHMFIEILQNYSHARFVKTNVYGDFLELDGIFEYKKYTFYDEKKVFIGCYTIDNRDDGLRNAFELFILLACQEE